MAALMLIDKGFRPPCVSCLGYHNMHQEHQYWTASPLEGILPPMVADAKHLCQNPPGPLPRRTSSRIRSVITTAADFLNPDNAVGFYKVILCFCLPLCCLRLTPGFKRSNTWAATSKTNRWKQDLFTELQKKKKSSPCDWSPCGIMQPHTVFPWK